MYHEVSDHLSQQHFLFASVYKEMEDRENKSFSQGFEASKLHSLLPKLDLSVSRVTVLV